MLLVLLITENSHVPDIEKFEVKEVIEKFIDTENNTQLTNHSVVEAITSQVCLI